MNKRSVLKAVVVLAVGLALVLVAACKKDTPQQDAFLQKWRAVAKQSPGHSDRQDGVPLDVDERNLKLEEGYPDLSKLLEEPEVEKPLPKISVSLEMRKANLTAVIAALAKAANVSVMISPEVSGVVTVNVIRKPWDEVFEGVLRTNGLAHSWEGDILRVKTLEDIERDVEMTALKARDMVQKVLLQRAEPPVTRIIRLRYSSAQAMRATIATVVFHREVDYEREEQKLDIKGGEDEGASVLEDVGEGLDVKQDEDEEMKQVPGYIWTDRDTNSLIVQAPRPVMKIIYYLVRKLDQPKRQVKIKAYIIETDSTTARGFGIQWGGIYQYQHAGNTDKMVFMPGGSDGSIQTYQAAGGGPQTGLYTPDLGTGTSGQGFATNFPLILDQASTGYGALGFLFGTIGENILEVQLQMLAVEEKIKILSSPSLTTQDNKEALLKDGMEIPYVTGRDDQGRVTIAWREAVLALRITPKIIDDSKLHMQIQIKKDELDFTLTNVEGIPVIRKKLAETELVTRSNETVVIGGLTRRRLDSSERGYPYLKDIPVLGWLFKGEDEADEQKEVLIFITPRILDYWSPNDIQKSFDQIDRELREDGIVQEGGPNSFIEAQ